VILLAAALLFANVFCTVRIAPRLREPWCLVDEAESLIDGTAHSFAGRAAGLV
jgi:hypothetical protein